MSNFGAINVAAGAAGAAITNAAINVGHAMSMDKLQQRFQRQLKDDQSKIDYIKNLVLRLQSLGTRLAHNRNVYPGTPEFDALLRKALINEMNYRGKCNADIYTPMTSSDALGKPRAVIGRFFNTGYLENSNLPKDVGPIWATGCKNAEDAFRTARIKFLRGQSKFNVLKAQKEDIGTLKLALKFGTGLFMSVLLLIAVKAQLKRIKTT